MAKITRSVFNLKSHIAATLVTVLVVAVSLAASELETTPTGMAAQQQATSARDILALARFYYDTNDTSDVAAKKYKLVIAKYQNSTEAETAQYYLGSYYHRKYYIRKERWLSDYKPSLVTAESEYERYISKYSRARSPEWLCDARFNLSLDYMEQENFAAALDQLQTIVLFDFRKDPTIFIHQVIWSENAKDVIDQNFNAKDLAEYARYRLSVHQFARGIEAIVPDIREWCRDRKNQRGPK